VVGVQARYPVFLLLVIIEAALKAAGDLPGWRFRPFGNSLIWLAGRSLSILSPLLGSVLLCLLEGALCRVGKHFRSGLKSVQRPSALLRTRDERIQECARDIVAARAIRCKIINESVQAVDAIFGGYGWFFHILTISGFETSAATFEWLASPVFMICSHPTGWSPSTNFKLLSNKELVGAPRFELGTSWSRTNP